MEGLSTINIMKDFDTKGFLDIAYSCIFKEVVERMKDTVFFKKAHTWLHVTGI